MKQAFYIVLFVFSFFPDSIFSQVKIEGVLRLGDTTQVLVLQTQNGDLFVGSLRSWSEKELAFKLKTGDLLHFKVLDVESMKVKDERISSNPVDPNVGQFIVFTNDGRALEGQVLNLNQRTTKMRSTGRNRIYLGTKGVKEIMFDPEGQSGRYENSFRFYMKNGEKLDGHLLHLNQRQVKFQTKGSKPLYFARSHIESIRYLKSHRPINGHRRALLLTPTGFNLRKGESEFRNIDYIHNSIGVGLSDHFSGTFGLMGIEPYVQAKYSYDFGQFLHTAVGGGLALGGAYGWFAAASVGTPDYFLNIGYMRNKGELTFDETDMSAIFFGGSMRVGNRQRLIAEFTHLTEQKYLFDANGSGTNTFAFSYGWFSRRVSLNTGLMLVENSDEEFCFSPSFSGPCGNGSYYFSAIPILSTSIMFGDMYKR